MNEESSNSGSNRADPTAYGSKVTIARWPTEIPLLMFVWLASVAIWLLLIFSILGIVYGLIIGLVLFLSHICFIAHVRGSAVRLGPNQLPELYHRVETLAKLVGMDRVPEAYLMQEGGALNAFATKFLRSHLMVLYSDLLEACGDDEAARDMIIGHELGHIKAGHLRWMWFLAPGQLVPFLGSAYSRAREYTCDRYGAALAGSAEGAVLGLAILAAGGKHARTINLESFVDQRKDLDSGWMTLAKWMSGYPALAERIAAIDPALAGERWIATRGPLRAGLLLGSFFVVPAVIAIGVALIVGPAWQNLMEEALTAGLESDLDLEDDEEMPEITDPVLAAAQVERDAELIARAVWDFELANGIGVVEDLDMIYELWDRKNPGSSAPMDPFDGYGYGFNRTDSGFSISSSGPDQDYETDDDITIAFATTADPGS